MRNPFGNPFADVFLWAIREPGAEETSGYVTACRLSCAEVAAERCDHVLADDDWFAEEDERGSCDTCGYPDPSICARCD